MPSFCLRPDDSKFSFSISFFVLFPCSSAYYIPLTSKSPYFVPIYSTHSVLPPTPTLFLPSHRPLSLLIFRDCVIRWYPLRSRCISTRYDPQKFLAICYKLFLVRIDIIARECISSSIFSLILFRVIHKTSISFMFRNALADVRSFSLRTRLDVYLEWQFPASYTRKKREWIFYQWINIHTYLIADINLLMKITLAADYYSTTQCAIRTSYT